MEGLSCPRCRSELVANGGDRWGCSGCGSFYGGVLGIPELRLGEDPYLDNDRDREIALRLADEFHRHDFRGLLDRLYDFSPPLPESQRQRQIQHILTAPGRASQWIDLLGEGARSDVLDLGCGSGSFLVAARDRGLQRLVGVDVALRWLVVARKRLDEAGMSEARLACANAEWLPWPEGRFGGIVAGDVIEHVADQGATLRECARVLRDGGRLVMATPNRFSLSPEPHVGLWGVGYLPRRWMAPYVRWRRGLEFRDVRTLGYSEWRRLLAGLPGATATIEAPGLPAEEVRHFGGIKRALARAYNAMAANRWGQGVMLRIGPLFHLVATKGRTPSRAIPPGSRPSRGAGATAVPSGPASAAPASGG